MTLPSDRELHERLTGLCTYLVQSPPFSAGDDVSLTFRYESVTDESERTLIPLNVTWPTARRDSLGPAERSWGESVVLVRATLAKTGGQPRDSLNQPTGDYDPDALTLSNVRVVDRSPSWDVA
ncbi:hypothetical protein OB955_12345 [Halobacteria archaeon AArc-m2/3/4]|uniref:Uncharacterized protein n=1 Tax=Natronoglomus mannanivorans TaxID=2979990 RepID=A0AAP2Z0X4_9EURY|nr:hypothetical protein [Halobacteria archaeon AArc-xg1-1]MCU4973527.1 hypothetical protein [Halobacteria archaeon AArc-m2/3/4]